MTTYEIIPSKDYREHPTQLQDAYSKCQTGDTIEVDGFLILENFWSFSEKPIHFRKKGGEGGLIVKNNMAIMVGPPLPTPDYTKAIPVLPTVRTKSNLTLTVNQDQYVKLLQATHLFVWSDDALIGLIPALGLNAIQSPGECHRIVEVSPPTNFPGQVVVTLSDGLLDDMLTEPKVVLGSFDEWDSMEWNLDIIGMARTSGRCAQFTGIPNLHLDISTEMAGDIAVSCPDANLTVDIRGQTDHLNHYGIVLGPWCSNFLLQGRGHGCRHVQTTSGVPTVRKDGETAQCGTPRGIVRMNVEGRYNAPLDTHAAGRGIVYDNCWVRMTGTKEHQGCVGIKVRARDTTIQNCRIEASDRAVIGSVGIDVWARGTQYARTKFLDLIQNVKINPPGTAIATG